MKILFISPPNYRLRGSSVQMFAYGPLFLAAVLKTDHDVFYYDAEASTKEEADKITHDYTSYEYLATTSHVKYLEAIEDTSHPVWKEVEKVITEISPDIIGLSTMTPSYPSALMVAKIAKRVSSALVVMGGIHATMLPEEVAGSEVIDYVFRGEGEVSFKEFVQKIERGEDVGAISGITYKKNGGIVHTPDIGFVKDLDSLPLPDMGALLFRERYPRSCFTNVLGGRGCPANCHFCANHTFWGGYRRRSADKIFEELLVIYEKYGKTIFFLDDNFMISKNLFFDVCKRIPREAPDLLWRCQSRVDTLSKDKLKISRETGCWDIKLGIESGSDRILSYLNKGLTVSKVLAGCEMILEHDIQVSANFMFGFPEETWEDLQATLDMIKRLPANSIAISKFIPLPGTKIYNDIMREGLISDRPPKYEHFDLYSNYYHYPKHVSREKLGEFFLEIFRVVDEKNKRTRIGAPKNKAELEIQRGRSLQG